MDAEITKRLKQLKELNTSKEIGCYIKTKGRLLNKHEQMICKIFPNSLYADHLWYEANGRILGQADHNGNIKPFTIKL